MIFLGQSDGRRCLLCTSDEFAFLDCSTISLVGAWHVTPSTSCLTTITTSRQYPVDKEKHHKACMYILHMSIAQLVVLRWFYADTADTMALQMFILTCPCDGICEDFRNQILRRT
jgi:hypothetical protein